MQLAFEVILLCLCLSGTIITGQQLQKETFPRVDDVLICTQQIMPSTEEVDFILNGKIPRISNKNCLTACLWRLADVFTPDDKFVIENASKFIKKYYKVDQDEFSRLSTKVITCAMIAGNTNADICTMGGVLYKCYMEKN